MSDHGTRQYPVRRVLYPVVETLVQTVVSILRFPRTLQQVEPVFMA